MLASCRVARRAAWARRECGARADSRDRCSHWLALRPHPYGVDTVEVNSLGMRASGRPPSDPEAYPIFGTPIHAPCTGVVLRAEDGRPDMKPPQPDREHLPGNSCSSSVAAYTSSSVTCSDARCESVRVIPFTLALLSDMSGTRTTPTSPTCTFTRSVQRRTARS
jgi:hypothetical protein